MVVSSHYDPKSDDNSNSIADGCITHEFGRPVISLNQSRDTGVPEILEFVQSLYGGVIGKQDNSEKPNVRDRWRLILKERVKVVRFLEDIETHCFLKRGQLSVALSCLRTGSAMFSKSVLTELERMKELREYQKVVINTETLPIPYVGGLTQAEVNSVTRIVITIFTGLYQHR